MIPDNELSEHCTGDMPTADQMYHNLMRIKMDEQALAAILQEMQECKRLMYGTAADDKLLSDFISLFESRHNQRVETARKTEEKTRRIQNGAGEIR